MAKKKAVQFTLRLDEEVQEIAKNHAHTNRRSLNTELGMLIEEGFKWRELQRQQAVA